MLVFSMVLFPLTDFIKGTQTVQRIQPQRSDGKAANKRHDITTNCFGNNAVESPFVFASKK